jgi:hypothetical protein
MVNFTEPLLSFIVSYGKMVDKRWVGNDFVGNWSWPTGATTPEFEWRGWGNYVETSVKSVSPLKFEPGTLRKLPLR